MIKKYLDFINESYVNYKWIILTDLSFGISDDDKQIVLYFTNLDEVYKILWNYNSISVDDNEIKYQNTPFCEWVGWENYINIYKIGISEPVYTISLCGDETWLDFMNWYNKTDD